MDLELTCYGYLRDHPIERVLRDVRGHQSPEGTHEIMRLIVGRDLLGYDLLGYDLLEHDLLGHDFLGSEERA